MTKAASSISIEKKSSDDSSIGGVPKTSHSFSSIGEFFKSNFKFEFFLIKVQNFANFLNQNSSFHIFLVKILILIIFLIKIQNFINFLK